MVLIQELTTLPEDEPVAWRETTKKPLGTMRYLFRVFLAIEIPLAVVILLLAATQLDGNLDAVSLIVFLIWVMAVLLVSVKATSLIAGERSHQTLDVLLTTPLTTREIVRQKFRGVRRLIAVLFVPFLTLFLFEAFWRNGLHTRYSGPAFSGLLYLVASVLTVAVYLPLVAWLSFWIGLRSRTQARAILAALAVIAGWCALPFLLIVPLDITYRVLIWRSHWNLLMLLSPATIIPHIEFDQLHTFGSQPWLAVLVNTVLYGAAAVGFRALSYSTAEKALGRRDT